MKVGSYNKDEDLCYGIAVVDYDTKTQLHVLVDPLTGDIKRIAHTNQLTQDIIDRVMPIINDKILELVPARKRKAKVGD